MSKSLEQKVIDCAVEQWNKSHAGISSIDIATRIQSSNGKVMKAMIGLEVAGKCSLNKNAELFTVSFGKKKMKVAKKATIAHFIFPSKELLTDHFYNSDLVRQGFPEYIERLHKGAQQYKMVYFSEEVLFKYLDRPDLYDVEDSLSGGSIRSNTEDESTHIYIRHGRHKLANGRSAILAPYKDLASLDEAQQRYWHAFEIPNPDLVDVYDENYSKFIKRTFNGDFVEYENPLENFLESLKYVNASLGSAALFRHTDNPHLMIPVKNTEKSFYDSCSELFKIIGADSLVASTINKILVDEFGTKKEEFIHKSGRPLSPFQQLQLLETKAGIEPFTSNIIEEVKGYRLRADHAIVVPLTSTTNFVEKFHTLCNEIANALRLFATKLETVRAERKIL